MSDRKNFKFQDAIDKITEALSSIRKERKSLTTWLAENDEALRTVDEGVNKVESGIKTITVKQTTNA